MIKLNLLPPQENYKQKLEQIHRFVVFISVALFVILLIFILLLGAIWFYLSRIEVSDQIGLTNDINEKVEDLNTKLTNINQILEERIIWSEILQELNRKVPSGIKLTSLNLNRENRKIDLRGKAEFREQMLAFQNNLKTSSQFIDIYSPLSNLIKPFKLDFSFSFYLNHEN